MPEVNFDDIPEQFRNLFIERDGQYSLDVQRLTESQRNAEDVRRALSARDNEKKSAEELRKQLAQLQEQFGGLDPSQLSQAMDAQRRIEELEHQQLIAEKKFEEAAEKKYTRQIAELQRQIEALNQSVEQHQGQYKTVMGDLENALISTQLTNEFIASGVNPKMVPYIIESARKNWELDPETRQPMPIEFINNGRDKVTAMGPDGKPLTFKGYASTFLQDNPWAALPSSGSNATHQRNGSSGSFTMKRDVAKNDVRQYEALKAQAAQAGADVVLVD